MDQAYAGTTDGTAAVLPSGVLPSGILPSGVAEALQRLESLGGLPTSAHVAAFADVQRRLDDALADIGDAAGAPGGQPQPAPPKPATRPHGPASAGHRGEQGNPRPRDEA